MAEKPRVICLCGSTRFPDAFHLANAHYSMLGYIVIGLGLYGHADEPRGAKFLTSDGDESTPEKQGLDQLHFRKIDLADAVVVVNVGGYIGSSTHREIEYAESKGKEVSLMFPVPERCITCNVDLRPDGSHPPAHTVCFRAANPTDTPKGQWQPIISAPKDGSVVLVASNHRKFVCEGRWFDGQWVRPIAGSESPISIIGCSDWMPLPPPPTDTPDLSGGGVNG